MTKENKKLCKLAKKARAVAHKRGFDFYYSSRNGSFSVSINNETIYLYSFQSDEFEHKLNDLESLIEKYANTPRVFWRTVAYYATYCKHSMALDVVGMCVEHNLQRDIAYTGRAIIEGSDVLLISEIGPERMSAILDILRNESCLNSNY